MPRSTRPRRSFVLQPTPHGLRREAAFFFVATESVRSRAAQPVILKTTSFIHRSREDAVILEAMFTAWHIYAIQLLGSEYNSTQPKCELSKIRLVLGRKSRDSVKPFGPLRGNYPPRRTCGRPPGGAISGGGNGRGRLAQPAQEASAGH